MDLSTKYQKLTDLEHILKRPGMYIGGIEQVDNKLPIYTNGKIEFQNIKWSPGLYKIVDEAIVNAYDQTIRDSTMKIIKINIAKDMITVYNDGVGIDVLIHPKEKVYIPELIFSHLRSSTSFSSETPTGGTHGLGIKLTNIFSKKMTLEVGDGINKKKFTQTYKNNMTSKSEAKVQNYDKSGYVKITFYPDFGYFGLTEFSEDMIKLLQRRVVDIAALVSNKIKVYLNDTLIESNSLPKYVQLYSEEKQYSTKCGNTHIIVCKNNEYKQISFINGIFTSRGGTHVEPIVNSIAKRIKEKSKSNIKTNFIKDQLLIVISTQQIKPQFSSQTKDELVSPVEECQIDDGFISKIYKEIKDKILTFIKASELTEIKKGEKASKKTVRGIKKLYDAIYAGTKRGSQCSLILTEGDSAKAMALSGLSAIPKANYFYGVFPLKGKLINVRDTSHKQIMANEEFINLRQIIGLKVGKSYENTDELRYGSIILMMDADVDGSHIKGLFLNMIHYYFESLLKIDGFVKIFITPIVKVIGGPAFYNLDEYEKWKKDAGKYEIKYYKGLGTNTPKEAKEYFANINNHLVKFKYIPGTGFDSFELAFSKDRSDDRKKWLNKYNKSNIHIDNTITNIEFINKELIHFSNYDNIRSIPNIMDGLKPSQRKVLYGSIKKNIVGDIKVAQLVGYISEHTGYHHGEASLISTIIGMCQTFIGANNINLLTPNGQFGTRLMGGKDHSSARYIYTQLEKITKMIYMEVDGDLLTYLDDDGFKIEPEYYYPIVPMILVNGCEGIGTGYSTYIPKFNIHDIIKELRMKLADNNHKFNKLTPFYNGFKGSITKDAKNIYLTKGLWKKDDNNIVITELPVTSWTDTYKEFLDELGINYINLCTDTTVEFVLKSVADFDEKKYGLIRVINMNNMYLYDSEGKIKKYKSTKEILDEYYKVRLDMFAKRKVYLLEKLVKMKLILESKIKFIRLILDKKVVFTGLTKEGIIKLLKQNKLHDNNDEYDYLLRMSFYLLTKEKIEELEKDLTNTKKEIEYIKNKTEEQLWIDNLDTLDKSLRSKENKNDNNQ